MRTKSFYTALATPDFEKTLNFYIGALGFHVAHRVHTPKGDVAVLENDEGAKIDVIETDEVPAGFHALRTNVDDLDAAIAELREKGYTQFTPPMQISTGRAILLRDPNDVLINLTEHRKK